jgi:stage V sporulation protein R
MIREEEYYFAPQGETKIMNEGWATYWHEKIMTERLLTDAEIIDFADHHSGTIAANPGQINPYRLGWQLWCDIEDRWNKGKFGSEYDDCDDYAIRKSWDKKLGLGKEKIFKVRTIYNDITFIDTFFNEEFCYEYKYFTYAYNKELNVYEIVSRNWKNIKESLLFLLTNKGNPFIYVVNGNYENRGELLLEHKHEGRDLHITYTKETLPGLYKIWKRPVHILTKIQKKSDELPHPVIISYNGKNIEEKFIK